ncbi:MAG: type II secretion system major pseudopilin GspG [Candidatus Omnitrophota bacterium]
MKKNAFTPLEKASNIHFVRNAIPRQCRISNRIRKQYSLTGFTLMELLVVMAIVVILAGMAVGGAQMARKRGAMTKAKAAIAALEAAIDMYELDLGVYPASGNTTMVQELSSDSNPNPDWNGPYIRFKEDELANGEYLDPWGNPYIYTTPGAHNTSSFDIYSCGPNGEEGGGDDIYNW